MTEENIAQTILDKLPELLQIDRIAPPGDYGISPDLSEPFLLSVPESRRVQNLRADIIAAAETFAPIQRRGTSRILDLASFQAWVNRHKDEDSVIFGEISETPSMTAVIDYNRAGPAEVNLDRDPRARHGRHRAHYEFPLSQEWKDWTSIDGEDLSGPDMGEFIEAHAKDVLNPTAALLGNGAPQDDWERDFIAVAGMLNGRFATYQRLNMLSREFTVNEVSNLSTSFNRDTGEQVIQFQNEHRDPEGNPVSVPNLFIIAIPVFDGGPHYRIPVRFRYRKKGAGVAFIISMHDPKVALRNAVEEAFTMTTAATDLPLYIGKPEAPTAA
ncbi:DUF2303 family protein [Thioclava sp. GXIMD4216]|uniref:DUF2303 family protein n=1 Tax=Thioclava sp. GXIMD4216 TaxID=3131929 RepID=UPI0030D608A7